MMSRTGVTVNSNHGPNLLGPSSTLAGLSDSTTAKPPSPSSRVRTWWNVASLGGLHLLNTWRLRATPASLSLPEPPPRAFHDTRYFTGPPFPPQATESLLVTQSATGIRWRQPG